MDVITDSNNVETSILPDSFTTAIVSTSSNPYYENLDFQWTRNSVIHMIDLVSLHFEEFYDKTIKKRYLWRKIAEEMRGAGYNCTTDDCDKKWRNIKKSYVAVLRKQVQGDFSSKFAYFDQMHAFLGREIDPLGMREQCLNQAMSKDDSDVATFAIPQGPFYEVTNDDDFEWTDEAVDYLLAFILQQKDVFKYSSSVASIWHVINTKMRDRKFDVSTEQCQRKWLNLSEGFRHYQNEAEASGVFPQWKFFSKVQNIINTVNVPVTIANSVKSRIATFRGTLKSSISTASTSTSASKRKRKLSEGTKGKDQKQFKITSKRNICLNPDVALSVNSSLTELEKNLDVNARLAHLETKIADSLARKAATKHTNDLLALILSRLKTVNKKFEDARKGGNAGTTRPDGNTTCPEDIQRISDGRLKEHQIMLSAEAHGTSSGTLVDEAACRQAILDMPNFPNLEFLKAPKVELVEGVDNDGIIIIEGL